MSHVFSFVLLYDDRFIFVTFYFWFLIITPQHFPDEPSRGLKRQPWEFGHFHRGEIESPAVAPQPLRVHG